MKNPKHYTFGGIECWDYLKASMPWEAYIGFLEGNVKKYMHRWRYKGKTADLVKARVYLDKLTDEIQTTEERDIILDKINESSYEYG